MNALEISGLSKLYTADVGLKPMHLSVPSGEVFGFIGPNGAGKTTTIRTLLGFLRPTAGKAYIFGQDIWEDRHVVHGKVGYLPGELHLHPDWTGEQLLYRSARLRGRTGSAYGLHLAERLNLNLSSKVGTLSKGNRQKVGLMLAMMHRPDLLILDEPTSGLDPLAQEAVLALMREAKGEGRTVFLSSHVLAEIERIADRVGFIRQGQMIRVEEMSVIKGSRPQLLQVQFGAPPIVNLAALPGMSGGVRRGLQFAGWWQGEPSVLLRILAAENVKSFQLSFSTLEEAFLGEYREATPGEENENVA